MAIEYLVSWHWTVIRAQQGSLYYFDLTDRAISTKKWNNCGNKRGNLCLTFFQGCSVVSLWLWENNRLTHTHLNHLFIGPYNLPIVFRDRGIIMSPSLLFFQLITNLVWDRCRSAQNNSRSQVTFSARKYLRLFWREGWGGDWCCCFKHNLEYNYFPRLVKVIIRILQPFLCFFFH